MDGHWNVFEVRLDEAPSHGGRGAVGRARLVAPAEDSGCRFIDVVRVPPGATIGRHGHAPGDEEYYVFMSGSGRMFRDGEWFDVRPGDLVRTLQGGEHQVLNTGAEDLRVIITRARVLPR